MSANKHTPEQVEAIANADAHLSNAGLPTFSTMLAALKALTKVYAPAGEPASFKPYAGTGSDKEIRAKWEAVRAAIAKARGEA
jgi:hypothetical protein